MCRLGAGAGYRPSSAEHPPHCLRKLHTDPNSSSSSSSPPLPPQLPPPPPPPPPPPSLPQPPPHPHPNQAPPDQHKPSHPPPTPTPAPDLPPHPQQHQHQAPHQTRPRVDKHPPSLKASREAGVGVVFGRPSGGAGRSKMREPSRIQRGSVKGTWIARWTILLWNVSGNVSGNVNETNASGTGIERWTIQRVNAIERNANAKGSVNETRQWTTQPSNATTNTTKGQHSPNQLLNGSSSPSTMTWSQSGTAHAHANTSATGMANGITYARADGSCLSLEYASGTETATSRWTPSASGRAMLRPTPTLMLSLIPTRCTLDLTDRMTRRRRWDRNTQPTTATRRKAKTKR